MRGGQLAKAAMGLAVASTLLLLAEGAVRAVAGPPPAPVQVHRVAGEVERFFSIDGERVSTTYQQHPPVDSFSRRAEGRRVVVLGGSSVHEARNLKATAAEWPGRLAQILDAEVLNLGEPGLDSFDHLRIVEELEALEVDAVVLYAGHNDIGNTLMRDRYGGLWGGLSAHLLAGLERSQLFWQLRRGLLAAEEAAATGRVASGEKHLDPERRATALRHFEANIARVVELLAARATPLVLVVPTGDLLAKPTRGPCDPLLGCADEHFAAASAQLGLDRQAAAGHLRAARDANLVGPRAPTVLQDYLRALGDRPGVRVVDAERDLPQSEAALVPDSSLFVDPIHLSTMGHAALAAIVAPVVAELAHIPYRPTSASNGETKRRKPGRSSRSGRK